MSPIGTLSAAAGVNPFARELQTAEASNVTPRSNMELSRPGKTIDVGFDANSPRISDAAGFMLRQLLTAMQAAASAPARK